MRPMTASGRTARNPWPWPSPTDDAPFIEIGGPAGPGFLGQPRLDRRAPTSPRPTRRCGLCPRSMSRRATFPRLATDPAAHLSVRFHDVARAGAKDGQAGPDGLARGLSPA